MSRLAFLLVFLLGTQLFGQEDAKEAAEKSATAWLALVDSGSYAESWDQAADVLKSAVTKQDWETKIKSVREQTGNSAPENSKARSIRRRFRALLRENMLCSSMTASLHPARSSRLPSRCKKKTVRGRYPAILLSPPNKKVYRSFTRQ